MTSQINPYNIDGAYPVAGQDNNSQGFRTNFTNTSTNFEYAAQEITDLQNNAVLKAALTGTTLDNDMNGSLLYNAETKQITQTLTPLGTVITTATISYTSGAVTTLTTGGSITLAFSNIPAAGVYASWIVVITVASTAHTVTLPYPSVSVNARGIQGLNVANNTITFSSIGTYTFEFSTTNGGTTIAVAEVNKQIQPFNNSSEDLANGAAANLALTTSYFSTAAAETATLAAGVAGQIKTFAMFADIGDMVITVTNAGWAGAGTITFTAVGQACTLQYINAKWFCIGNNGCTFA
jgi:hypothetical protein